MYDSLTRERWASWLEQDFRIPAGAEVLLLRLQRVSSGMHPSDLTRDAYALEFLGPASPVVSQGTYTMTHEGLGELPIFIVPVGRNRNGVVYEAVFN